MPWPSDNKHHLVGDRTPIPGPVFVDNSHPSAIPEDGFPNGEFRLDSEIFQTIFKQWRDGKQIVLLIGAGLSAQSGYPTLGPLGNHLIALESLGSVKLHLPGLPEAYQMSAPNAYSLERDGWISPNLFPELFSSTPASFVRSAFRSRLQVSKVFAKGFSTSVAERLNYATIDQLSDFAKNFLGATWFNTLDKLADYDPQLVDALFDAIGTHVQPGPAHNLLAQFVSWFNVKLILTTNFDSLIEQSIKTEYEDPYVFDVHVQSSPPSQKLIRQHLSVVKLHGTHFGIRADNTINRPLDEGQLTTFRKYFDNDSLIIALGYGGGDKRVMDILEDFLEEGDRKPATIKHKLIRIDDLNLTSSNPFAKLSRRFSHNRTFVNLYYPHSRYFLLDVMQKCSSKMPNTRTSYPSIPHTPSPFQSSDKFGFDTNIVSGERANDKIANRLNMVWHTITRIRGDVLAERTARFAVVTDESGDIASQVLAQVCELSFKSHQLLWCDLDEAASVGTLVSWLYDFALSRQPDLPRVPLPLDLPPFVEPEGSPSDIQIDGLLRVIDVLWDRLKRDRYLIVLDSVSTAALDMIGESGPLMQYEAARIIIFVALLVAKAAEDVDALCFILIGARIIGPADQGRPLFGEIKRRLKTAPASLVSTGSTEASANKLAHFIDLVFPETVSKSRGAEGNGGRYYLPRRSSGGSELDPDDTANIYGRIPNRRFSVDQIIDGLASCETMIDLENLLGNYQSCATDSEQADRSQVTPIILYRFLIECALCNRPRSWSQVLALPAVNDLSAILIEQGEERDPTGLDSASRAARALLGISVDCNFLRRQQGAFYYMRISLRSRFRRQAFLHSSGFEESSDIAPTKSSISSIEETRTPTRFARTNEKMLRYYERTYNLSGDITALNYYFWHASQLFLQRGNPDRPDLLHWKNNLQFLNQLARGLLENTNHSRGHLGAYDHTFLLLRLRYYVMLAEREVGNDSASLTQLRSRLERVLTDLYEEAEDDTSGKRLFLESKGADVSKYRVDDWHQLQKIHARSSSFYRACAAGILTIFPDDQCKPNGIDWVALRTISTISPDSIDEQFVSGRQAIIVSESIVETLNYFNAVESRRAWLDYIYAIETNGDRTRNYVLRGIVRLVRNIDRIYVFGIELPLSNGSRPTRIEPVKIEALISAGKMCLATLSISEHNDSEIKMLWSRYHSIRGVNDVYTLSAERYSNGKLYKVYYALSLARAYALRAGGAEATATEAITDIYEMEALIWEARMILSSKRDKGFDEARARQESAIEKGVAALAKLTDCRLALVRWRELAILNSVCHLDVCKRLTNECMSGSGTKSIDFRNLEAHAADESDFLRIIQSLDMLARSLEAAGMGLHFMRPTIWNDAWREARIEFQVLRLCSIASAWLSIAIHITDRFTQFNAHEKLFQESSVVVTVSVNRILRALRLIGGDSLARHVGVSPSAISNSLLGPATTALHKIAKVFNRDSDAGENSDNMNNVRTLDTISGDGQSGASWEQELSTSLEFLWTIRLAKFESAIACLKERDGSGEIFYSGVDKGVESLQDTVNKMGSHIGKRPLREFDLAAWQGLVKGYQEHYEIGHY